MSTPRDRDGNDFDPTRGWQEPAHLGGGDPSREVPGDDAATGSDPSNGDAAGDEPNLADRRRQPRGPDAGAAWQPAGWDLPPAEPERPARGSSGVDPSWAPPQQPAPAPPLPTDQGPAPERRGLFGRRRQQDPEMQRAFTYQGDLVGAQGWALQRGWAVSDGTAPEDAPLQELIGSAPVRMSKDHRPGSVLRGRAGMLEIVAFDAVYASGRYLVPEYAITAVPLLAPPPVLRLSPARLWKHGIGGMVQIPTDDDDFEGRWTLLAAEDGPQVRRLAADADVRRLLLGTDDGDEFWTSGSFLAAIRPDGHRPELLDHHVRLLTALVGALAAGY